MVLKSPSTKVLLLVLTALALGLRLYHLGTYSLWYDEALYIVGAGNAFGQEMIQVTIFSAFLVSLLLKLQFLFGSSDIGLRFIQVLLGTATVPLVYRMVRLLSDRRDALLCAAFLAVSPLHVFYSQTVRKESLYLLVVVSTMGFFLQALRGERRRYIIMYGVLGIIAITMQPFCIVLFGAAGLYATVRAWRDSFRLRAWIGVHVVLGALAIVWFWGVWMTFGRNMDPITFHPSMLELSRAIKTFFFGHHLPDIFLYPTALVVVLLGLLGVYRMWQTDRSLFYFILSVVTASGGMYATGWFWKQELLVIRYYVFLLPIMLFVLVYGLRRISSPWLAGVLTMTFLCLSGLSLSRLYNNEPIKELEVPQRKDYRGLTAFILKRREAGDQIVHFHRSSFVCVEKYTSGEKIKNRHLLFDLPECAQTNQDNKFNTKFFSSIGLGDSDARTELSKYAGDRVWVVFSQWQHEKRIYAPGQHLWSRSPSEAALDWFKANCEPLEFKDENHQRTQRKIFDNNEWFSLYLFRIIPKGASEPVGVPSRSAEESPEPRVSNTDPEPILPPPWVCVRDPLPVNSTSAYERI